MPDLIHHFIAQAAATRPDATAILYKDETVNYAELQQAVADVAAGFVSANIAAGERIAVYLPKQKETVYSIFGAAAAGACFVPINPLLKPHQVHHILRHSETRILVTSRVRLRALKDMLLDCPRLHTIVLTDEGGADELPALAQELVDYAAFSSCTANVRLHRRIDADLAAILYTSGSTGQPKGVALSHRNLVAGAQSVASYLENCAEDRLLAVLPLSFDAGLSQLTTAFSVGASVVLLDYLMPRDVIRTVARYQVTGLGAVPPLWNQLRDLEWPREAVDCLRYITNTGGAMPVTTTRALQAALPQTDIFLMYGLTEAFRSTFLPPDQLNTRPDSIGRAIPNAQILVVDEDGRECAANQPGELVHRGALVSLGYWRDPEETAKRFRPCPGAPGELPTVELAVWSGDQVRRDEEGYLYFISRLDDMIKTSGYRVSPTEVEEIVSRSGLAEQSAALGLPHAVLGQAILLLVTPTQSADPDAEFAQALITYCRTHLPSYMVPAAVEVQASLPRNQNGKIDRAALSVEFQDYFGDKAQ